jgi:hypothetical protein
VDVFFGSNDRIDPSGSLVSHKNGRLIPNSIRH